MTVQFRSPFAGATAEYAGKAEERGSVIIAGAGGAAHLAGVIAAQTILPVIGVPLESGLLGLIPSSTVRCPGVAGGCVAIGKAGARNAGILAVPDSCGHHPELKKSLHRTRLSGGKVEEAAKKMKKI